MLIMCVRRFDTDTRSYYLYHTYCKFIKKIAKDDQSAGLLMSFGVKKQTSTLTAYGTATAKSSHEQCFFGNEYLSNKL